MFKENKDDSKKFKMVIPANIRFKFYPSKDSLVLENKFAAIPLTLPLTKDMPSAYPEIQKGTKFLKSSMTLVYALYALGYWSNKLMPRSIVKNFTSEQSDKFSIGFSNTPGPIKPFFYKDNGREIFQMYSATYLVLAGKIGLNLACTSFCNSFKITCTSDTGVYDEKEVEQLCKLVEELILKEIETNKITLEVFQKISQGKD